MRHIRAFTLLLLASGALFAGRYAVVLSETPTPAGARQRVLAAQTDVRRHLAARSVHVTGSAQRLLNAVFVSASRDQAEQLRSVPGVKAVLPVRRYHLLLDKAIPLQNVPAAWNVLGGKDTAGAGVKIAIIDSGIDQTHPGFQAPSLTPPAGFPKCSGADCAFTNNKVIVARSYIPLLAAGTGSNPAADSRPDDVSPRDHVGHGTALGMIAAGVTNTGPLATITGVAPGAFLGNYKVFGSPGVNDATTGDIIVQALEDALNDGMDIAVLALGGLASSGALESGAACGLPPGVPCDAEALAIENAVHSGLTVVAAAGNSGDSGTTVPTLNTIESPATAPSVIAVGASTNSHFFTSSVRVQGVNVPQNLQFIPAAFGDGPLPDAPLAAPLKDVAALDGNGLACSALPSGSLTGAFALILRSRNACSFAAKVQNAQNAGANGVIIIQEDGLSGIVPPGGLLDAQIPAVMIGNADGQSLKSYLDSNPKATATLDPTLAEADSTDFNQIPDFSSRGPSIDLRLKPELVAVATNLYMAAQKLDPNGVMYSPTGYTVAQGTSFAAPTVAGAVALVKQKNPTFTPAQLKSAIVNTASQDVTASGVAGGVLSSGNGKMNGGNAVQTSITVDPSVVSFVVPKPGFLKQGDPPPQQKITIRYSGAGQANLTLSAESVTGNTPTLDKSTLALAGSFSTDTVTLSFNGTVPPPGIYEGAVTIQGAGAPFRIPYVYLVPDGVPWDVVPLSGLQFSATTSDVIPQGLAFRIIDEFGVPVAGVPVTFDKAGGAGVITRSDAVTNGDGVATADITIGPSPGKEAFSARTTDFDIPFSVSVYPPASISGVGNAAGRVDGATVAPGAYVAIFGDSLSDASGSSTTASLPLSLDLVSVSFDVPEANLSLPGRLMYVSPGQVNVQAPWELAGQSSVIMKVNIGGALGKTYTAAVSNYSPAVYSSSDAQTGSTIAAALDANSAAINSRNPARRGQVIQVYMNGLGPVDNQPPTGEPAGTQPLSRTLAAPAVTIGGKQADVQFSGLTPGTAGLNQLNLVVPSDAPAGMQPLVVSIGGVSSLPVNIPVQ